MFLEFCNLFLVNSQSIGTLQFAHFAKLRHNAMMSLCCDSDSLKVEIIEALADFIETRWFWFH